LAETYRRVVDDGGEQPLGIKKWSPKPGRAKARPVVGGIVVQEKQARYKVVSTQDENQNTPSFAAVSRCISVQHVHLLPVVPVPVIYTHHGYGLIRSITWMER
jgi:hypothetical protein